ncbi:MULTISPECIES: aldo/keto reductase [Streptomyces]|uniref:Aldo/keto reductase n=2 Tax=Streptomyces TaxID=1883 RepID=A0ABV9J9R5_9ACTN
MKYTKLGSTGLDISPICLGCMTFGVAEQGWHAWTIAEDESRAIIRQALGAGINFFDTANVYSNGSSEEILGRALKDFAARDEVVIATKAAGVMRQGRPNGGGLSRKAIMTEVDASLRRLGTDYIDLYQIHRLDPSTPLEETLETLNELVRCGKVRYLGASSMYAWQFGKALHLQRAHGWARFVSMQNHYNLLNREEEREMLPLCADEGVGSTPWSPLARGRLTRDPETVTERSRTDDFADTLYPTLDSDRAIIEAVASIATERSVPRAQVALAWVSANPVVSAPIVGARTAGHLEDAIASLDIDLTSREREQLQAPYTPRGVAGF